MREFQGFLSNLSAPSHRERLESILLYIHENFPHLDAEFKWNQPMFSDHGTFIIGCSVAKGHISIAPEAAAITRFEQAIKAAGYTRTKEIFKIKWTDPVNFELLHSIVAFNIEDKKDMTSFWRALK